MRNIGAGLMMLRVGAKAAHDYAEVFDGGILPVILRGTRERDFP